MGIGPKLLSNCSCSLLSPPRPFPVFNFYRSQRRWFSRRSAMCKGQDPPHFSRTSSTEVPLRRVAEAEEELAATRARLAASVEALRRERERAAELLRRLEESLAERERLRKVVAVMDAVRAHLIEARLREIRDLLQRVAARDPVV